MLAVLVWHFQSIRRIMLYTSLRDSMLFMLENHLDLSFWNAVAWEQGPRYGFFGSLSIQVAIIRSSTTAGFWVHIFCINGRKHSDLDLLEGSVLDSRRPGAVTLQALKETGH